MNCAEIVRGVNCENQGGDQGPARSPRSVRAYRACRNPVACASLARPLARRRSERPRQ